jgi:hypothetical protein
MVGVTFPVSATSLCVTHFPCSWPLCRRQVAANPAGWTPVVRPHSSACSARVRAHCRISSGHSRSKAKRVDNCVIATRLNPGADELAVDNNGWSVGYAPRFLARDTDDERVVRLDSFGTNWQRDDPYVQYHPTAKLNDAAPGRYEVAIETGDLLLLDEAQSTIGHARARHALNGADGNPLYNLLDAVRTDDHAPGALQTPAFDSATVEEFCDELETAAEASDDEEFVAPNDKQRDFITEVEARLSLLQGPPGTGKTKGALANGLLARASTRVESGEPLAGLVTGPTHTAIDEVFEETAAQRDRCIEHDVGGVEDVSLVRLHTSAPRDEDDRDGVEHLCVKNNRDLSRLLNQLGLRGTDSRQYPATVVFATPQAVHRLVTGISEADSEAAAHSDSPEAFDLLAVDEASMMRLSQLFMASPLASEDAQVIFAGDHRQMPPVQQHDWDAESRLSIAWTGACCSALNYLRFLRGDEVERLERHEYFDAESPEADEIKFTSLERTYRCHLDVTEFLCRWMYERDNIEYTSDRDATLCTADGDVPAALQPVFSSSPLVLITHDDRGSQQRNQTEANLVSRIADLLPDEEGAGVVAPHNAQKALVNALTEGDVDVDTVERFQGGEREAIVVSATASDPAYLDTASDFIMNPNRLNVALSRMKKKLVVVAPESLFDHIPTDKYGYEDARIWKALHETATEGGPDTEGYDAETGATYHVHTFDGYDD